MPDFITIRTTSKFTGLRIQTGRLTMWFPNVGLHFYNLAIHKKGMSSSMYLQPSGIKKLTSNHLRLCKFQTTIITLITMNDNLTWLHAQCTHTHFIQRTLDRRGRVYFVIHKTSVPVLFLFISVISWLNLWSELKCWLFIFWLTQRRCKRHLCVHNSDCIRMVTMFSCSDD